MNFIGTMNSSEMKHKLINILQHFSSITNDNNYWVQPIESQKITNFKIILKKVKNKLFLHKIYVGFRVQFMS